MTACIVCQKAEPADSWTTCRGCYNGIDKDLLDICVYTRAAAMQLTPEKRGGAAVGTTGSRPPLSIDAIDAAEAHDALPLCESWERLVREHLSLAPYGPVSAQRTRLGAITPPLTLEAVTGFLRAQLAMLAGSADFPLDDFADEMHQCAVRLARWDQTRTGPRPGVPVRCPADHPDSDGRPCGWTLWTDGTEIVVCPQCCTSWDDSELLDAHEMDLLPTSTLILLDPDHPNPRKRIQNWAARNRLTEHDRVTNADGQTVPLYRLGEYRNLLSTTRATKPQPDLTTQGEYTHHVVSPLNHEAHSATH